MPHPDRNPDPEPTSAFGRRLVIALQNAAAGHPFEPSLLEFQLRTDLAMEEHEMEARRDAAAEQQIRRVERPPYLAAHVDGYDWVVQMYGTIAGNGPMAEFPADTYVDFARANSPDGAARLATALNETEKS